MSSQMSLRAITPQNAVPVYPQMVQQPQQAGNNNNGGGVFYFAQPQQAQAPQQYIPVYVPNSASPPPAMFVQPHAQAMYAAPQPMQGQVFLAPQPQPHNMFFQPPSTMAFVAQHPHPHREYKPKPHHHFPPSTLRQKTLALDEKSQLVCRHWLEGRCTRYRCQFKHSVTNADEVKQALEQKKNQEEQRKAKQEKQTQLLEQAMKNVEVFGSPVMYPVGHQLEHHHTDSPKNNSTSAILSNSQYSLLPAGFNLSADTAVFELSAMDLSGNAH